MFYQNMYIHKKDNDMNKNEESINKKNNKTLNKNSSQIDLKDELLNLLFQENFEKKAIEDFIDIIVNRIINKDNSNKLIFDLYEMLTKTPSLEKLFFKMLNSMHANKILTQAFLIKNTNITKYFLNLISDKNFVFKFDKSIILLDRELQKKIFKVLILIQDLNTAKLFIEYGFDINSFFEFNDWHYSSQYSITFNLLNKSQQKEFIKFLQNNKTEELSHFLLRYKEYNNVNLLGLIFALNGCVNIKFNYIDKKIFQNKKDFTTIKLSGSANKKIGIEKVVKEYINFFNTPQSLEFMDKKHIDIKKFNASLRDIQQSLKLNYKIYASSSNIADELYALYANKKSTVFIHTGFVGHAIYFLIDPIKERFYICNKGFKEDNSIPGIQVYYISKKIKREDFILLGQESKDFKKFSEKFNIFAEKYLLKLSIQDMTIPTQKVGNCAVANARLAVRANIYTHLQEKMILPNKLLTISENGKFITKNLDYSKQKILKEQKHQEKIKKIGEKDGAFEDSYYKHFISDLNKLKVIASDEKEKLVNLTKEELETLQKYIDVWDITDKLYKRGKEYHKNKALDKYINHHINRATSKDIGWQRVLCNILIEKGTKPGLENLKRAKKIISVLEKTDYLIEFLQYAKVHKSSPYRKNSLDTLMNNNELRKILLTKVAQKNKVSSNEILESFLNKYGLAQKNHKINFNERKRKRNRNL